MNESRPLVVDRMDHLSQMCQKDEARVKTSADTDFDTSKASLLLTHPGLACFSGYYLQSDTINQSRFSDCNRSSFHSQADQNRVKQRYLLDSRCRKSKNVAFKILTPC